MSIDPKVELHINEKLAEQHKLNKDSYAAKMVERIVYYAMSAIGIAVLGALLKLVII